MNIYVAVRDTPDGTMIIGAFSAEGEAREACQEDADGDDLGALVWEDTRTAELDDLTRYDVILCELNRPVGT